MADSKTFRKELAQLLNYHSLESGSDTPDFILAKYLANCLVAFDVAMEEREKWYGREIKGAPTAIPASMKHIHKALEVSKRGQVNILCQADETIYLPSERWTISSSEVTCLACLKLLRAEVEKASEELKGKEIP